METILSLLQNFNKSDFYSTPVPHIVINNALPEKLYNELLIQSPKSLIKNNSNNNNRGDLFPDQIDKKTQHELFFKFLNFHRSSEFFYQCTNIFKDDLEKIYPNIISNSKKKIDNNKIVKLDSNSKKKEDSMTFTSIYGYNTPVTKTSSVIGPHIDHYDKIFFGLYYMREPEDNSIGGDLILYKWKNKYSNYMKKNIIFTEKWNNMLSHSEEVKKIKYEKNTFILALNSIDSLHGVSKREKTNHIRQFCYISFAFNKDLKFATPNLIEKIFFKNISIKNKLIIILNSFKHWINFIFNFNKNR